MKKLGIMFIALALLLVGMTMADPGAVAVREVQGLTISTTVIGAGNFNQASSVQLQLMNADDRDASLLDIPDELDDFTLYTTVYTEDTQNS
jgi:hypothetical protein